LSPDKIFVQSQLQSEFPNLILEQKLEWFDEFQLHGFRKTTHIVMGFNDGGGSSKG